MAITLDKVPGKVNDIFRADSRIVRVRQYHDGFLPNNYGWKKMGKYTEWTRDGRYINGEYNMLRSYGQGPRYVGYSAVGGTLVSVW